MYISTGFWRLEFAIQSDRWGLPLALTLGAGGHSLVWLCFEVIYWRGAFRYSKEEW